MALRNSRSKLVSSLEKRLGRGLSNSEAQSLRLALYARAVKLQREQKRVYKPRMELHDDGHSPRVVALFELPGLRPDELSVDVIDGRLIVGGERRPRAPSPLQEASRVLQAPESIQDGVVALRSPMAGVGEVRELKYGFFRRVVPIPEGCTTTDLEATMENGMLSVSWPRNPHARIFAETTNGSQTHFGMATKDQETEDMSGEESTAKTSS